MRIYISLLRGINVSGQKKIKMADLRSLYEELNFTDITTYIQSGNVIFSSKSRNLKEPEKKITKKIEEHYNFTVPVIILTPDQIKDIIECNPFLKEKNVDTSKLYVTILKSIPSNSLIEKVKEFETKNDKFIFGIKEIYLFFPNGFGKAKLSNNFFENKLKVEATSRNWRTINKLYEIANKKN